MESENFWIIEVYSDDTANISIMSKEEAEAVKDMKDDFESWQIAPCSKATEEDMIERAEDHGLEHDPW